MAILPIRTFGDPVLRQRAITVEGISDLERKLIDDMIDTMRDAPGVGLAATQVGSLARIFVWEVGEQYGAVLNPTIVQSSDEVETDEEGCLSLPGIVYEVERPAAVTIGGLDRDGETIKIEAEGLQARVFQHEIDHLDGVLFIDRLPGESRKEALAILREEALGLRPPGRQAPAEETL